MKNIIEFEQMLNDFINSDFSKLTDNDDNKLD